MASAATRPCIGPSGIPPGSQSARGVALMGGSAARGLVTAIDSRSNRPRFSTAPVFVLPKCALAGEAAARLTTTATAGDSRRLLIAGSPYLALRRVYGYCVQRRRSSPAFLPTLSAPAF